MAKINAFPYLYYQKKELALSLGGKPIRVISKPGLPHCNEIPPAMALLADVVRLKPRDQVLLIGCGHGALCAYLALQAPQSSIQAIDPNIISLQMTAETLRLNQIRNVEVSGTYTVLPQQAKQVDIVVMQLPKGRKLSRRFLLEGYEALKPGGTFYLAGPNQEGIQPVIKDAQALFGNGTLLGYKKGNRVARMVKQERHSVLPDWVKESGIAPGTWYEFQPEIQGHRYLLRTLPGVFSFGEVDEATLLLLNSLEIRPGWRVLDIGCGYGIIGLYAAHREASWVDLVDSDLLAVAAAGENLRQNNIQAARAFTGDGLSWIDEERYDCIVSNPPFHTGKDVDYDVSQAIIQQSRQILQPGGKLILVASAFIRYDRTLQQAFGNVSSLAKTGKFHVWEAKKE